MNELEGKVALVTGGSRGIGAAVALRLARGGADVVLTYERNGERAASVVDQLKGIGRRALAIRADSADVAAVTGASTRWWARSGRDGVASLGWERGPLGFHGR
jgi:3-oxoacyl-[acyl-carrier protein] reductase